jgi:hypothetical protein
MCTLLFASTILFALNNFSVRGRPKAAKERRAARKLKHRLIGNNRLIGIREQDKQLIRNPLVPGV